MLRNTNHKNAINKDFSVEIHFILAEYFMIFPIFHFYLFFVFVFTNGPKSDL